MNWRVWAILFVLIVSCIGEEVLAGNQCDGFIKSNGRYIKQYGEFPIMIYLNKKLIYEYHGQVRLAVEIWNRAIGFEIFRVSPEVDQSEARDHKDSKSVVYVSYGDGQVASNEAAATYSKEINGGIVDSDIVLNGTIPLSIDQEAGKHHVLSIFVHEFGHVLGLADNQRKTSVMYMGLYAGQYKAELDKQDLKNIRCAYSKK